MNAVNKNFHEHLLCAKYFLFKKDFTYLLLEREEGR